jgi:gas vesicle protein
MQKKNGGKEKMSISSIIKGVATGVAVGTAAYIVASSSPRQKRMMKRDATRTARAAGDLFTDFTSLVRR